MNIKCEICGKVFYKRPSHYKRVKHNYCSLKCRGISHKGSGNPMWSGFKICEYCGKEHKGKGKMFCSRKCMGLSKRNRINTQCAVCGKDIVIPYIYKDSKRFCGKRCADIFHSDRMIGKGNPNWLGGIGKLPWGYEFTDKLKAKIKKRDGYQCRVCGKKDVVLAVHHIDYDKHNNKRNNLITLCERCHGKTNYNREKWTKELSKMLQ